MTTRAELKKTLEEAGVSSEVADDAVKAALPMGARSKKIDRAELLVMGKLHLSQRVMAPLLGLSRQTLQKRLAKEPELQAIIEQGQAVGKRVLTEAIVKTALSGNPQSQRMLARQWLGWRDDVAGEGVGAPGSPEATNALLVQMLQRFTQGQERAKELEAGPIPAKPEKLH